MKRMPEPVRMLIVNVESEDEMEVLANPERFNETIEVNWHRHQPVGFSSTPMHYLGTSNAQFNFSFWHDVDVARDGLRFLRFSEYADFWRSLTVPRVVGGQVKGAPPKAAIIWPGTLNIIARVISYSSEYSEFGVDGSTRRYDIDIKVEVDEIVRVSSQNHRSGWVR